MEKEVIKTKESINKKCSREKINVIIYELKENNIPLKKKMIRKKQKT